MKYAVLASGSQGNATYLQIDDKEYLIDAGISLRQIELRLHEINIKLNKIDGVFITHEHIDHVAGLASIIKKFNPRIYLSKGTYEGIKNEIKEAIDPINMRYLKKGEDLFLNGIRVVMIPLFHDANEPLGFRFIENEKSLVYITDTGYFPEGEYELISNADDYVFESNHEPEILLNSNRYWGLKKRILDDNGHLSNEDSAVCICKVIGNRTKRVVLAHISRDCNLPEIGILRYKEIFEKYGYLFDDYEVFFAKQDETTQLLEV